MPWKLSSVPPKSSEQYKAYEAREYHVYRRRWYILALYSMFCLFQALVWNTFGPIAYATQFAYGWSDGILAMMLNWACIFYLVFLFPVSYFMEWKGLRHTMILVSFLVMAGSAVRTFSKDPTVFEMMSHLGAILNGIAGITVMSAPPAVAATWFPEKERIFATAIAQGCNIMGSGVSFLIGPIIVPYDDTASWLNETVVDDGREEAVMKTRQDIQNYMIGDAVVAAIIFLLVLAYFPAKPSKPPCASSSVTRTKFTEGWKELLTNKNAWLVCLTYSIPGAIQTSWQSLIAINFEHLGVSDTEVGNIGFLAIFVQGLAAICVGFVQDSFRSRIKFSLIGLFSLSTACLVWLTLVCLEVIPYSLWQLYVSTVVASCAMYSCIPLCFELAVMIAFPSPEGLVGAYLTGVFNGIAMIFLFIFFIPGIGTQWMNYVAVVGTAVTVPLILATKTPVDFVEDQGERKQSRRRASSLKP